MSAATRVEYIVKPDGPSDRAVTIRGIPTLDSGGT